MFKTSDSERIVFTNIHFFEPVHVSENMLYQRCRTYFSAEIMRRFGWQAYETFKSELRKSLIPRNFIRKTIGLFNPLRGFNLRRKIPILLALVFSSIGLFFLGFAMGAYAAYQHLADKYERKENNNLISDKVILTNKIYNA